MRVAIFGTTGMIGRGVLAACLADDRVRGVLSIGRSPCPLSHPKLDEIVRSDLFDLREMAGDLESCDACFFSLGVSAVGMDELSYHRITYELTIAVAKAYESARPGGTFCYVSGQGTDSTEKGRAMWARVKGKTENRLLEMRLKAFMLRPGYVQPSKGVRSKTAVYNLFYAVTAPVFPIIERLFPRSVTTSENLGRAMIELAVGGHGQRILGNPEINAMGRVRI